MYAKKLTKEYLELHGVTDITEDCKVFIEGKEVKLSRTKQGYFIFNIYKFDDVGNVIKKPTIYTARWTKADGTKKEAKVPSYAYANESIPLHRAMWAWYHGEVPAGMVIDHINNKHIDLEDNRLDNLQLLTPKLNVTKDRGESTKQLPCKMSKPREYYEEKLEYYVKLNEEAKMNRDSEKAHRLRAYVCSYKARLRYWDAHKYEYYQIFQTNEEIKNERELRIKAKLIKDLAKLEKNSGNKEAWHRLNKFIRNIDNETSEAINQLYGIALKRLGE